VYHLLDHELYDKPGKVTTRRQCMQCSRDQVFTDDTSHEWNYDDLVWDELCHNSTPEIIELTSSS